MLRIVSYVLVFAFVVGCARPTDIPDDLSESQNVLITAPGSPRAPCVRSSGPCVDMYVAAHEDDDMLFMNPDIHTSISRGNKVIVAFVTAGNLDEPGWSDEQKNAYWTSREYGVLDAYKQMGNPLDAWTGANYQIPGTTKWVVKYTRPSTAGADGITLIFFRLEDLATTTLWNDPFATKATLSCFPCPSDADQSWPPGGPTVGLAAPVVTIFSSYTRETLVDTMHRLMGALGVTSVSTLDATHGYFALLGGPTEAGQLEYPEHYHVARTTVAAAARYQAASASTIAMRFYRGYTSNQEGKNLSDAETLVKKRFFAYYKRWDVGDGTQTNQPRKATGLASGTPDSNPYFAYDNYDTRWPQRSYATRSLVGTDELRGRISVKTGAGTGCLSVVSGMVRLATDCNTAPTWILTATNLLKNATTGLCLEASAGGSLSTVACTTTPIPEGRTFFFLGNGQIIGRDGKCLSGDPSTTNVTFGECAARCINQFSGATQACPTLPETENPGAAGPQLTQEWTLLFTQIGLLSGTNQSQFNYTTTISSAPSYWNTFSIADRNFCVRRSDGVHCVAANGFTLGSVSILSNFTDASGWNSSPNGGTVRAAYKSGSTTVACGRGYYGVSCSNGEMAWDFSTIQGWDAAAHYYGSVRYVDVNSDGKMDICGRGSNGINCALHASSNFHPMTLWANETFTDAAGWNANGLGDSIQFGDVNGDGKPDVCGRGIYDVECLFQWVDGSFFNKHNSSFDADRRGDWDTDPFTTINVSREWSNGDPLVSWGSSTAYYGSMRLVDVNRDGFADLCSRGPGGIYCAFSYGNGFGPRKLVAPFEFTDTLGWSNVAYGTAIQFGDVDGDSRVDVCGRGYYGVVCTEGY